MSRFYTSDESLREMIASPHLSEADKAELRAELARREAEPSGAEARLGAMGAFADNVATITGMKQQFLHAGWSEASAEQMVICLVQLEVARGRNNGGS